MAQRCTDSITEQECLHSDLLRQLHALEVTPSQALTAGWFGVDAFYVLWRAFNQLDQDADGYLTAADLARLQRRGADVRVEEESQGQGPGDRARGGGRGPRRREGGVWCD